MSEKRMLIIDADVVKKIDENRGDMDASSFLSFLIDSRLQGEPAAAAPEEGEHVTREEFAQFQQGIRELLRNFMEFFLSYGLELGQPPEDTAMKELNRQLKTFASKTKSSN